MAPDDWPEWLPSGWTMQVKKIGDRTVKCYLDPEGHKFYSKPQVFRYLKNINGTATENTHNADGSTGDITLELDVPHKDVHESSPRGRTTKRTTGSSSKKSKETVGSSGDGSPSEPDASQKDVSVWLPDGWSMEVKTRETGSRIGMKYKCYTDSASGRKFFSKPQVLNYLANANSSVARHRKIRFSTPKGDKSSTEPDKSQKSQGTKVRNSDGKKKESVRQSSDYEVISRTQADGLPPGWIKEVRVRNNTFPKKKDPFYLDPLSGYIFLSKLDALRYLDTGDIKKCAMRPLRRDINEDYHIGDNPTGEKLAVLPDTSKGDETSEALPNGCVVELKTKRGRKYKGAQSSLEPDTSRKTHVGSLKRSVNKKKSTLKAPYDEVISTNPADGLPPGWIKEIRTRKYSTHERSDPYYIDPLSGYEFRSKLDALRYLETGGIEKCAIKPTKNSERVGSTRDGYASKPRASRNDDVSEWLPDGWIAEVKTRGTGSRPGMKFKCYTDPVSGRKFYSKPQVLDYLASGNSRVGRKRKGVDSSSERDTSQNSYVGRRKRFRKKKKSVVKFPYNEVVTTSPADGLPPGWIKETRTRKYSTHQRSDPYYVDPLSGYEFRSKLDAFRYLETGDIETCAIKPTKRDINGKTLVGAIDGQTPENTTTRRQLFEDNNVPTEAATAEKTPVSTPARRKATRIPKRGKSSATSPGRSSKRLKGLDPETKTDAPITESEQNGTGKEKQVTGVNVEKQTGDESGEDGEGSWTDQCLDFAVKTLTGEIQVAGSVVNEDPTIVK